MAEVLPEIPVESKEQEDLSSRAEMPRRPRLFRRLLKPLTEAYFVGIGAADWMIEQAVTIERNLSERGHRRNETFERLASKMGTTVSEKTRAMSSRGRERMRDMGKRVSEGMTTEEPTQEMPAAAPV